MVGLRLSSMAVLLFMASPVLFSSGCMSAGPNYPQGNAVMMNPAGGCPGCAQQGQGGNVRQAGYLQQPDGGDGNTVIVDPRGMNMAGMGPMGMGAGGPGPIPGELKQVSLPPYTVAPPDILFIDALRMIPKGPYRIEPYEVLLITATNTLPNQDIKGPFTVGPDGRVALGYGYGSVLVGGRTLTEAMDDIRVHLSKVLAMPAQVTIGLAQIRGMQQIRGEHLVRPDGTITLGTYGSVYVAGMSLGQIKTVVEKHLSNYLQDPQVSVDVFAYNSKVYYVIFDGAGYGMQVFRLPITGNETVLDAVSRVNGLAAVASKRRLWLARPSPANCGTNQVMPIDWNAITQSGSTATNYQIFPGDRIYVDSNCLIRLNNYLSQVLNPVNQVMGSLFLGINTALGFQSLRAGTGLVGF
jgi:protein involved in polysaccharide export with SLBB domain